MTSEEYWNSDPNLAISYRELYRLQTSTRNSEMWLQGMYIYEAFAVVIHNAFAKKNDKTAKYPSKPYMLAPQTKKEEVDRQKIEQEKAIRSLNAWKEAWDRSHGRNNKGN